MSTPQTAAPQAATAIKSVLPGINVLLMGPAGKIGRAHV